MRIIILYSIIFLFLVKFSVLGADIKGTVNSTEGELADAVVYIGKIEGKTFPVPDKPAVMDQKDLTFVPHVLPVLAGTTVIFPNSDVTRHSVFSPGKTKKFDFGTYTAGTQKSQVFDKPGVVPLLCHVHPEMSAFIIVLETPYFAVTNEKGSFRIKNVPPGKYILKVWHEWGKSKEQHIEVTGKEITINFYLEE